MFDLCCLFDLFFEICGCFCSGFHGFGRFVFIDMSYSLVGVDDEVGFFLLILLIKDKIDV